MDATLSRSVALDGTCRITDRGVIRASGPDAATFLQGQLTNDVLKLPPGRAMLAGFCSAKGRLQATFIVWREGPEDLLLMCSSDLLVPTLKRLSMFVLRAKCKLSNASEQVWLHGVVGDSARALVADRDVWSCLAAESGTTSIRLTDVEGMPRALIVTGPGGAGEQFHSAPVLSFDDWRWLDVRSGIVTIEAATVDRFVPQMVNFELVGGVDFQKGCYPGQEVVARSQYRGTTKRRTFLFDTPRPAVPGTDVFAAGTGSEAVGTVANAANDATGRASALVEMRLAHSAGAALHLGSQEGPLITQRALPYSVVVDTDAAA